MARDTVFTNANVIALDEHGTISDTLTVRNGRVFSLHGDTAARGAEIIDCGGRTIIPGFIDTHIHLYAYAKRLSGNDLNSIDDQSIETINRYIARIAEKTAPGEWITIFGYDQYNIAEKRFLTRWDIDSASPSNPVRIYHRSGQGQLCNSRALELMGIDVEFEDLDGGLVDREVPSGEPTGMLYGMDDYISAFVPEESGSFMNTAAALMGQKLAEEGITCVHDATLRNDLKRISTFEKWSEQKLLPQKIYSVTGIESFIANRDNVSDMLRAHPDLYGIKLILNEIRGSMNISDEQLFEYFKLFQKKQVHGCVHCVDEAQLEAVLRAVEAAREACPNKVSHRIEHASLCDDEMIDKIAAMNMGVSTQPAFLYYSGERYLDTIDEEQLQRLYRFGSLNKAGVNVSFSSDAPISPASPMKGIYSAVTRKTMKGRTVLENEAVSVIDALKMYTINGAKNLGIDAQTGSLVPGKCADFIVLDKDPLSVDPEELKDIKVDMTYIDGELVWKR